MALPFSTKVITITGGARGIGLATARYLVQRGATVCIADILKPELAKVVKIIEKSLPESQSSGHPSGRLPL